MYLGSKNNTADQPEGGVTYFNYNEGQGSKEPGRIEELITDEEVEEIVDDNPGQGQQEQQQDCNIDAIPLGELLQEPNSDSFTNESPTNTDHDASMGLPAFIKMPLLPNPGYVTFLQSQDVFALPPIPIQWELVKSFVEYIYPRMPLLDLESFLNCLNCLDGSSGQINLVLYSAILFAGSTHVDEEVVSRYGYSDRKLLRKELYKRTQVRRHQQYIEGTSST